MAGLQLQYRLLCMKLVQVVAIVVYHDALLLKLLQ